MLDAACIFASVFLAYATYQFLDLGKSIDYSMWFLVKFSLGLCVVVCVTMYFFKAYNRESGILNVKEVRGVILGILAGLILVNALFFAFRFLPSRYFLFLSFAFMLLTLPLVRSIIYTFMTGRMARALKQRVLIYGAGELGRRLFREIHNSPRLPFQVVGFIDDDQGKSQGAIAPTGFQIDTHCKVLGGRNDLPRLVTDHAIDRIFIAISNITSTKLRELFVVCRELAVEVAFVPFLHEIFIHRLELERVGNLPLMREQRVPGSRWFDPAKRATDLLLSVFLGIMLLPLAGLIALAIKTDSQGPVFFRQSRVGKNGRIFQIYKFRSMVRDTPSYAVNPQSPDDPRITRVGRFLRKTSLDELPQIINVFRGEMSFVGPRPEMPFIVEQYNEVHKERLSVLPGITGLWQLSGDRKKAIHENMDYDLYYIYNQSFFMDITILLQTLIFAFRGI